MSGQNFSHIFESDRWTICHRAFVNLMTLRFPAYLGNDPGLGLVRIVDDLGVLGYLLLAPDAGVEVGPDAAAVLAHHHLARPQVGLVGLLRPRRRVACLGGSAGLGARRGLGPRRQLQLRVGPSHAHDLLRRLTRRRRPARRRVLRPAAISLVYHHSYHINLLSRANSS